MSAQEHDLRKIMEALEREYARLRQIWQEFNELFAKDSNRIDLMNDVAPVFFSMVQNLMIEAMVIRMARMTDAESTGGYKNLSLSQITRVLPNSHADHINELTALISDARDLVSRNARQWRCKGLAHLDYHHFMSDDRAQFTIGLSEMRECIEAIHAVLNRTNILVWDNGGVSSDVSLSGGTVDSLIAALKKVRAPE